MGERPLPTETPVGGGEQVGAWMSAPMMLLPASWREICRNEGGNYSRDFPLDPGELRRRNRFRPGGPGNTDGTGKGRPAPPSCPLHLGPCLIPSRPLPERGSHPLTERNPFPKTATGRAESFGFSKLESEGLNLRVAGGLVENKGKVCMDPVFKRAE